MAQRTFPANRKQCLLLAVEVARQLAHTWTESQPLPVEPAEFWSMYGWLYWPALSALTVKICLALLPLFFSGSQLCFHIVTLSLGISVGTTSGNFSRYYMTLLSLSGNPHWERHVAITVVHKYTQKIATGDQQHWEATKEWKFNCLWYMVQL